MITRLVTRRKLRYCLSASRSLNRPDANLMSLFPEYVDSFRYILVIADLFSHHVYVCLLTAKSDAFMALMNFGLLARMHFIIKGVHVVKYFHFDNAGEVISGILISWYTEKYPEDLEMVAQFEKWSCLVGLWLLNSKNNGGMLMITDHFKNRWQMYFSFSTSCQIHSNTENNIVLTWKVSLVYTINLFDAFFQFIHVHNLNLNICVLQCTYNKYHVTYLFHQNWQNFLITKNKSV